MKLHSQRFTLTSVLFLLLATFPSAQNGYDLFQQALVKERGEGKLAEAIGLFQKVVDEAGTDRGLAAKALVEMAGCYEKLGSTEALRTYQRAIAQYPDQSGPMAIAR